MFKSSSSNSPSVSANKCLFCVPLKKTSDIDITKPLANIITSIEAGTKSKVATPSQSNDDSDQKNVTNKSLTKDEIDSKLVKLQQYRRAALIRGVDGGCLESHLVQLENYYDQLCFLEQKIPFASVQINFKWRNAFDKGSFFSSSSRGASVALPSIFYEKACVMFNLAAKYANTITALDLEQEENLQKSLRRLQLSGGMFSYLRGCINQLLQQEVTTSDFDGDVLGVLSDLMVAQGQELVVMKAMGKMKDSVIAKLASQAHSLYSAVSKCLHKEAVVSVLGDGLHSNVSTSSIVTGKAVFYQGLAEYHQAAVHRDDKCIGKEISRLQHAKALFSSSALKSCDGNLLNVNSWLSKTSKCLDQAVKDNDFIYHEVIPNIKSLDQIPTAVVAKATSPLPPPPISSEPKDDLFSQLCPVSLVQALVGFEARRRAIINDELKALKEATRVLDERLTNMNLPASVEKTKAGQLPQSLKDKSDKIRDGGGLKFLEDSLNKLPEMHKRNSEILDECERMVQDENSNDAEMRIKFGSDKWKRTASDKLTSGFTANVEKYRSIISTAREADDKIRDKINEYRGVLASMSMGGEVLQKNLSSTLANSTSPQNDELSNSLLGVVARLRGLMDQLDTLKAVRLVLESEISGLNVPIRQHFLNALQTEGMIDEERVSMQHLNPILQPLKKQSKESLFNQESLMEEVCRVNGEFVKLHNAGKNASSKSTAATSKKSDVEYFKELASTYAVFVQLKSNLDEGCSFYANLTDLLLTFQNKLSDFVFARNTEKEELLKNITMKMAHVDLKSTTKSSSAIPPRPAQPPSLPVSTAAPQSQLPYPVQPQPAMFPAFPSVPGQQQLPSTTVSSGVPSQYPGVPFPTPVGGMQFPPQMMGYPTVGGVQQGGGYPMQYPQPQFFPQYYPAQFFAPAMSQNPMQPTVTNVLGNDNDTKGDNTPTIQPNK